MTPGGLPENFRDLWRLSGQSPGGRLRLVVFMSVTPPMMLAAAWAGIALGRLLVGLLDQLP